jgi:hypothetical protein
MHLHHPILAPRAYALSPSADRRTDDQPRVRARFTRAGVIPDGAPEP